MGDDIATAKPASTLAVPDASLARMPGQFSLSFTANREFVRHEIAAWSVGLKWLVFDFGNTVRDPKSPLLKLGKDDEYLATVEQPSFEEWIRENLDRHMETHEAALLRGLVPGKGNALPVENILIDRLLKEMVQAAGIDLHGPAEEIRSDDYYIEFLANSLEYMGGEIGGRHFQLRQAGLDLPIMSTFMPLGRAMYGGHALDLDHQLPETICLGVVGRRLGDLVATGLPTLDARIITEVITSRDCLMDYRPYTTKTRLRFEPDLIEIGS